MCAVFGRLEVTHTLTINTYYIIGINDVLSQLKVWLIRSVLDSELHASRKKHKNARQVIDLQCAILWRPGQKVKGTNTIPYTRIWGTIIRIEVNDRRVY